MFQCGPYQPVPATPHFSTITDTIASSLSEQVARIGSRQLFATDHVYSNNNNNNVDDDGKVYVYSGYSGIPEWLEWLNVNLK